MKLQKISIATARIKLTNDIVSNSSGNYYTWKIDFSEKVTGKILIKAGEIYEDALDYCNQIKKIFEQAQIDDGDKVAIIFNEKGNIRAISRIREDSWIDVKDNFVQKTFKGLNIKIGHLKVY